AMLCRAAASLAVLAAASMPAMSQSPPCGPKASILGAILSPKYGEAELMILRSPPGDVRLYSNMTTGSWTLIGFPNSAPSMACILGAGNKIDLSKLPLKKGTNL
nr:hypothetical protein [Nitrospira sp.]